MIQLNDSSMGFNHKWIVIIILLDYEIAISYYYIHWENYTEKNITHMSKFQ